MITTDPLYFRSRSAINLITNIRECNAKEAKHYDEDNNTWRQNSVLHCRWQENSTRLSLLHITRQRHTRNKSDKYISKTFWRNWSQVPGIMSRKSKGKTNLWEHRCIYISYIMYKTVWCMLHPSPYRKLLFQIMLSNIIPFFSYNRNLILKTEEM